MQIYEKMYICGKYNSLTKNGGNMKKLVQSHWEFLQLLQYVHVVIMRLWNLLLVTLRLTWKSFPDLLM